MTAPGQSRNRSRWPATAALALCLSVPAPAALSQAPPPLASPVLTLNIEELYSRTIRGQDVTQSLEARIAALGEENSRIAAELEAEELDLTERRPGLPPDEFRALADAFDEKVQKIRTEQDAKQRDIQRQRDEDRQAFLTSIAPILSSIAAEAGGVVILDRRTVLLSADGIDITELAIERINASLGAQEAPGTEGGEGGGGAGGGLAPAPQTLPGGADGPAGEPAPSDGN